MFSLVLLILASDTDEYIEMQKIWKGYMNKHPNVKSYFIKYKRDLIEDIILHRLKRKMRQTKYI